MFRVKIKTVIITLWIHQFPHPLGFPPQIQVHEDVSRFYFILHYSTGKSLVLKNKKQKREKTPVFKYDITRARG